MKIYSMVLGPVQTNVYAAVNEATKECFLVDPADRADLIVNALKERALKPAAILLTHGHFDHIMAIPGLRETYPDIPVLCMEQEMGLLGSSMTNLSRFHDCDLTIAADRGLADGEELELAGFQIRVIHTPGHTGGGACYYISAEDVLFSGDTLFRESVGRSDFVTGDGEALIRSIKEKLLVLPDETRVYPGHGSATSIGHERTHNYFLK